MPMIDIYAVKGTFSDTAELATSAAATMMQVEGVPDLPMFRKNTAAFVHEVASGAIANVDGDEDYVRVQVLTNKGALDRDETARCRRATHRPRGDRGRRLQLENANVGPAHGGRGRRLGTVGARAHQRRAGESGSEEIARLRGG